MKKEPSRRQFVGASLAVLALASSSRALGRGPLAMRDPFVERLLVRMTPEEKAGQLSIFSNRGIGAKVNPLTGETLTPNAVEAQVREGRTAGYYNSFDVGLHRRLQRIAAEESRLRIPLIFAADMIHGLRTGYPVPVGEAASFDPDLCRRTARASAVETTAFGVHWAFGPMVDVARDQRWGRVVEGAGEDPWLVGRIGAARVQGLQGDDLAQGDTLLACPKHFAAYGGVEGGKEYNTVDIPETTLRQVFLPPFRAAFDAGALSTMSAFNDVAGVPATGNRHLLTDILRTQWGFRGLVVSDFQADRELIAHGFAADEEDAVVKAITAGCDMSMESGLYAKHLPALVRAGRVPARVVDEAVRRVLRVKKALGLFDDPYRSLDPARQASAVRTPAMVALSREAGRRSIVLLKNEGGLLPLPKTGRRIAFIGPFVADRGNTMGSWMVHPDIARAVTLEEGVRAALGSGASISVTPGCTPEAAFEGGIAAAVAAARAADVVVLYVGEPAYRTGEAASTVSVTIPPAQQALAEAVAATGKPMVVLLKHGRALALAGAVRDAQAIACTWYLGSESGNAIADVLFGEHAPEGRLPVSFPQESGQEPFYYDHRTTGRPQGTGPKAYKTRYAEVTDEALYPFGHGLGYSTVVYGPTEVDRPTFIRGGSVAVRATLTNTGARAQHEVAQLYVHNRVASVTQPVRVLRGIRHVDIRAGAVTTVEFRLAAADFTYVHADLSDVADSSLFDVWIAPSSTSGQAASITMVGA